MDYKEDMKQLKIILILLICILNANCQDIKVNAGIDLNLTCFDEIQLNGKIINWTSKSSWEVGLKSIVFATDSIGYAAGGQVDKGIIIKTVDGGNTWSQINCPANRPLNDILFLNKDTGFIVGGWKSEEGIILKTINGGSSWSFMNSPTSDQLNSVFFINNNVGYAAGDSSSVIKTIDGGETWSKLDVPAGNYNDVYFTDELTGFIVGDKGRMIKTVNGGENWESIDNHIVFNFYSVVFKGNYGYVSGAEGLILYTDDLFQTYSIQKTGVLSDLFNIQLHNKDTALVVGKQNTILTTINGGKSWKQEFSDYNGDLYSSFYVNNSKHFAIGGMPGLLDKGCILSYKEIPSTLKTTWSPSKYLSDPKSLTSNIKPIETTAYILNIADTSGINTSDTLNVNVRFSGAFAGKDETMNMYDTIQLHGYAKNGKWGLLFSESGSCFKGVSFVNKDTGFIVGSRVAGTILKTTDGGKSWQHKIFDLDYSLDDINCINDSTGYIVGDYGTILKTTDCGESWNRLLSNTPEGLNSLYFVNENVGYVAGAKGTILKTINGGNTWQRLNINTTLDLSKIYFINETRGFATAIFSWECAFFETKDGGNSWQKVVIPDMFLDFTDIFFVNDKVGYMIGGTLSPFGFIKTIDGGETWKHYVFPRSILVTYTSAWFTDEFTGYVSNGIGEIIKTIDGGNSWYIWDTIGSGLNDMYFIDKSNAYGVGNGGVIARYHANEGITIHWSPDYNILNENSLHPLIFPYESKTYYLEISTEEGCSSIDNIHITVNKSSGIVNTENNEENIDIFPNPSIDHLTIGFNNKTPDAFQIRVFDSHGAIIYRNRIFSAYSGEFIYSHNLASGVYFLEISGSKYTTVKKFIVE